MKKKTKLSQEILDECYRRHRTEDLRNNWLLFRALQDTFGVEEERLREFFRLRFIPLDEREYDQITSRVVLKEE